MSMDDVRNWYLFWLDVVFWFREPTNQTKRWRMQALQLKRKNLFDKAEPFKSCYSIISLFKGNKRKVSFHEILTFFPSCKRNAKGQPTRGKWCIGKQQYMKKEHVWEVKFFSLRLNSLEDWQKWLIWGQADKCKFPQRDAANQTFVYE